MVPSSDEPEPVAPKTRIAPKLLAVDWDIVDLNPERAPSENASHAIRECTTDAGPTGQALCVDGRLLRINGPVAA